MFHSKDQNHSSTRRPHTIHYIWFLPNININTNINPTPMLLLTKTSPTMICTKLPRNPSFHDRYYYYYLTERRAVPI